MLNDLRHHERSVYSQCGEDGVLERIFDCIGVTNRYFVEFGAKDGNELSNTAFLRLRRGWEGLLMEAGEPAPGSPVKREFVTAENVTSLFDKYRVPRHFDLLSIDIDGNDYWVWKAIDRFVPRVVVVEYNIFFGLDRSQTIQYTPDHVWDESTYHGASLLALRRLGAGKGYALVHTDSWAPNAFFVHRSELPAGYCEPPIELVTPWNRYSTPPGTEQRDWVTV